MVLFLLISLHVTLYLELPRLTEESSGILDQSTNTCPRQFDELNMTSYCRFEEFYFNKKKHTLQSRNQQSGKLPTLKYTT